MDTQTTQILLAIAALVLANIGTTIGLFTWATSHASAATQSHREEVSAILQGIAAEMKDFHGRLCAIEERAKLGNKADK